MSADNIYNNFFGFPNRHALIHELKESILSSILSAYNDSPRLEIYIGEDGYHIIIQLDVYSGLFESLPVKAQFYLSVHEVYDFRGNAYSLLTEVTWEHVVQIYRQHFTDEVATCVRNIEYWRHRRGYDVGFLPSTANFFNTRGRFPDYDNTPYKNDTHEKANTKANNLLLNWLTESQHEEYTTHRRITCIGNVTGRAYVIHPGFQINIEVFIDGCFHRKACVVPVESLPLEDHLLAQKLMIETEEQTFLDKVIYW